MNIAVLFISFLILFTIILLAVSIGLRYLEERRKSQVSGMLQTASGEKPAEAAPLLEPVIEEQQVDKRDDGGVVVVRSSRLKARRSP